jgi:sulfur-oxidizing protein SoxY
MREQASSSRVVRRRVLQGAGALVASIWIPARAADAALPEIPALTGFLAGRPLRFERVHLDLPRLADNGLSVPMKIIVDGPFAPGREVRAVNLFSEANPVPEMAAFEFVVPVDRVEIESRIRLAATQHVVAVATMSDGVLLAAVAEVIVTIAGCMDGT